MKTTLANLLTPHHSHYSSLGDLAAVLRMLIASSPNYRDKGRWGSSGPFEVLTGYSGCTNGVGNHDGWESGRMTHGQPSRVTTWQENHGFAYSCILESICTTGGAFERWQQECGISLHMPIKIPMTYQHNSNEKEAWKEFESIHKFTVEGPSLNSCHRRVNFLAEPVLLITEVGVYVNVSVTQKTEFKTGPCFSRWDYGFLTGRHDPKWNMRRETFAAFILRAVAHFKTPNPSRARNY